MYRYCADCEFLKVDDKGNGVYKCTKLKKDVLANMDACDKFEFSYRKKTDRDKYYDLGKESSKKSDSKSGPMGMYIVIVILLVLILIICSIFM